MSENSRKGITAVELLQVAFIVLKLCKVIKWSWLWVLSPMWITTAIVILLGIALYIAMRWINRRSKE